MEPKTTTTAATVYADNVDAGKRAGMSDRAAAAFATTVVARCVALGLFAAGVLRGGAPV